jgi:hypothetical protein
VDSVSSLPATLERLDALVQHEGLKRSDLISPEALAAMTALPESTVRTLLRGGQPPADTVSERVRARIKALADAHLTAHGQRMSDLAGNISRQLGVSPFWARQVCAGEKVPSVELLHGLVTFFGVDDQVGEAFFTAPASEALNRALLTILAAHQPPAHQRTADHLTAASLGHDDVRGVALRQARDLPEERWNVLNATLKALLELDDKESDR